MIRAVIVLGVVIAALLGSVEAQAPPASCEERLAAMGQFATLQRQGRDQAEAQLAEERALRARLEAQLTEARSALVRAEAAAKAKESPK